MTVQERTRVKTEKKSRRSDRNRQHDASDRHSRNQPTTSRQRNPEVATTCRDTTDLANWVVKCLDVAKDEKLESSGNVVVHWAEFIAFIQSGSPECPPEERITITGTALNAYADKAGGYLDLQWPDQGKHLLAWMSDIALGRHYGKRPVVSIWTYPELFGSDAVS